MQAERGRLTIQLMDSLHQPRFMELSFNKEKWTRYVEDYTQNEESDLDVRKRKLFLLRYVACVRYASASDASTKCSVLILTHTRTMPPPYSNHRQTANNKTLMENVEIENRLECKICLSTYRLFYVEDTEDFFYRKGQLAAARQHTGSKTRLERFNALCDAWAKRKRSHTR